MAKISIIIPIYNSEKTIKDCLDSLDRQTFSDFEIIAVNDGSTDGSRQVLEKYPGRLTVIDQPNAGAAAARNSGAKIAKSQYIIFIDADSVLEPTMLEIMLKTLQANPQAAYAYCAYKFGPKNFYLFPFSAEKLRQMPYIHTSSLIRREHFPGFDKKLKRFQDWDLYLTMLERGHMGVFIPQILFKVKGGGTMSNWLPSFMYKIPFFNSVKRYREAEKIIIDKHGLGR